MDHLHIYKTLCVCTKCGSEGKITQRMAIYFNWKLIKNEFPKDLVNRKLCKEYRVTMKNLPSYISAGKGEYEEKKA